jgi:hypothetical protein
MVEAPPSKNHKTRIPAWHPRDNKPPLGQLDNDTVNLFAQLLEVRRMHSAFFVLLVYCISATPVCQHIFISFFFFFGNSHIKRNHAIFPSKTGCFSQKTAGFIYLSKPKNLL